MVATSVDGFKSESDSFMEGYEAYQWVLAVMAVWKLLVPTEYASVAGLGGGNIGGELLPYLLGLPGSCGWASVGCKALDEVV